MGIQLIQANFTTKILDEFAKPPILIIPSNSNSTIQHMLLNTLKSPGPQPQLHRNSVVYPLIGSCLRIFISQKKKLSWRCISLKLIAEAVDAFEDILILHYVKI